MIGVAALASAIQLGSALNCDLGYAALAKQMAGAPGARPMPVQADTPYGVYVHPADRAIYTFTVEGAPGHPAIVRRQVVARDGKTMIDTSACGFGDKAGFDELMRQMEGLNESIRRSVKSRPSPPT